MVYTKEEFKRLWETDEYVPAPTYDDIADCAKAWGISSHPRTRPIDEITYKVLKAAQVNDAEDYNPNPTSQCDGRIMIDLDKACEWLEKKACLYVWNNCEQGEHGIHKTMLEDFRKAMKGE